MSLKKKMYSITDDVDEITCILYVPQIKLNRYPTKIDNSDKTRYLTSVEYHEFDGFNKNLSPKVRDDIIKARKVLTLTSLSLILPGIAIPQIGILGDLVDITDSILGLVLNPGDYVEIFGVIFSAIQLGFDVWSGGLTAPIGDSIRACKIYKIGVYLKDLIMNLSKKIVRTVKTLIRKFKETKDVLACIYRHVAEKIRTTFNRLVKKMKVSLGMEVGTAAKGQVRSRLRRFSMSMREIKAKHKDAAIEFLKEDIGGTVYETGKGLMLEGIATFTASGGDPNAYIETFRNISPESIGGDVGKIISFESKVQQKALGAAAEEVASAADNLATETARLVDDVSKQLMKSHLSKRAASLAFLLMKKGKNFGHVYLAVNHLRHAIHYFHPENAKAIDVSESEEFDSSMVTYTPKFTNTFDNPSIAYNFSRYSQSMAFSSTMATVSV